MWVVSKNESNCLSENKMVSILIWRRVSLLYIVQSNILWLTFLLSYHYRCTCNVVFTNYRFPVSFLLYIATPKKLNQIITVNTSTNTPRSYHQKKNSCTLCVPMFLLSLGKKLCFHVWACRSLKLSSYMQSPNYREPPQLAKFIQLPPGRG